MKAGKFLKWLFLFTLLLSAVPFGLYGWARLSGSVPDAEAWWNANPGANHGPWVGGVEEYIVAVPMLLLVFLPLLTLFLSIVSSIRARRGRVFLNGLILGVFQWALSYTQFWVLYWTID